VERPETSRPHAPDALATNRLMSLPCPRRDRALGLLIVHAASAGRRAPPIVGAAHIGRDRVRDARRAGRRRSA